MKLPPWRFIVARRFSLWPVPVPVPAGRNCSDTAAGVDAAIAGEATIMTTTGDAVVCAARSAS